jgi:AhpC/TSA antioxidant enzyme
VPYFGIVKEIAADPTGLAEFSEVYFLKTGPLYRDVELRYYQAFGNQYINMLPFWNPFKLYQWGAEIGKRMKEQKIEGNLKGEGMIKGGILIFDQNAELQYAQEEAFGTPLDTDELRNIIRQVYYTTSTNNEATTTTTTTTASDDVTVVKEEL